MAGVLTSAESQSFMPLRDINTPFMFQTVIRNSNCYKNNLPKRHNGERPSVLSVVLIHSEVPQSNVLTELHFLSIIEISETNYRVASIERQYSSI